MSQLHYVQFDTRDIPLRANVKQVMTIRDKKKKKKLEYTVHVAIIAVSFNDVSINIIHR